MYLLDTDHLSVLERGGADAERLRHRLQALLPAEIAATVVSYEEQTRGWLSYLAKARSLMDVAAASRWCYAGRSCNVVRIDEHTTDHGIKL